MDAVAEPCNNFSIFSSPSTIHEAAISLENSKKVLDSDGWRCWQAGWWWEWGWVPMAAVSEAVLAEFSVLFPVEAERCRWSVPGHLQVNVCAGCVPIQLQLYWSLKCFPGRWFSEGVQVNFSVAAFRSLFSLALLSLAWCGYLVIVRCQECIAVMTEECIWAANSSEYWEVTASLWVFDGINP